MPNALGFLLFFPRALLRGPGQRDLANPSTVDVVPMIVCYGHYFYDA